MKKIFRTATLISVLSASALCAAAVTACSHTHTFGEWTGTDTGHTRVCSVCGYEETSPHIRGGSSCTECGYVFTFTDGLVFNENNAKTGYIVGGITKKEPTEVIIPSEYDSKPVVGISENAFSGEKSIKKLVIPRTIAEISENSFKGCDGVEDLTAPASALAYVPVNALVRVKVTSGDIPGEAFKNCAHLSAVQLSDGVASVGDYAFHSCAELKSAVFPESVKSIGAYAFSSCAKLENVSLSDGICKIGAHAFYGCAALTGVTLPGKLQTVETGVFGGCVNLLSVSFPDGVKEIKANAFLSCVKLSSLTFGAGLESIDKEAFFNCGELKYVSVSAGNANLYSENNCVVTRERGTLILGCGGEIPSGTEKIGDNAFALRNNAVNVNVPEGVREIGERAFYGCKGLGVIDLPSTLASVGNSAFTACTALEEVNFYGSASDWGKVKFGIGNENLTSKVKFKV